MNDMRVLIECKVEKEQLFGHKIKENVSARGENKGGEESCCKLNRRSYPFFIYLGLNVELILTLSKSLPQENK